MRTAPPSAATVTLNWPSHSFYWCISQTDKFGGFLACEERILLEQEAHSQIRTAVLGIFFFSLLFIGVGQTAVSTLGIPYIDDNVASKESAIYIGKIQLEFIELFQRIDIGMWRFVYFQQSQLALESLDRRLVLYSARSVPDCLWIFRILGSVRTIQSGSVHGILVSFFSLICLFVISSFRWVLYHKQPKKWPVQMRRSSLTEAPTHISGFFCRKNISLCQYIRPKMC